MAMTTLIFEENGLNCLAPSRSLYLYLNGTMCLTVDTIGALVLDPGE